MPVTTQSRQITLVKNNRGVKSPSDHCISNKDAAKQHAMFREPDFRLLFLQYEAYMLTDHYASSALVRD